MSNETKEKMVMEMKGDNADKKSKKNKVKKSKKDKKEKKNKKEKRSAQEKENLNELPKAKKSKKEKKSKKQKKETKQTIENDESKTEVNQEIESQTKTEEPKVATPVSEDDVVIQKYRENKTISVESSFSYTPAMNFDIAKTMFPEDLLKVCAGFTNPSPIQSESWPIMINGNDMIGIAVTGSGKTLAFAMPSIVHIRNLKIKSKGPKVLVVAPTRELACQINDVYMDISKTVNTKSTCIYGGVPKQQQMAELRKNPEVIVCTPGRLLGLMEEKALSLSTVSMCVLDEADRMLDKGFEPDIRRIMKSINNKRQIVMFSATWPEEVRKLAGDFMVNPCKVTIGSCDLKANESVTQHVEVIDKQNKNSRLVQLLKKHHNGKNRVLIFVLYKKEAPMVERYLNGLKYKACAVHGDLSQYERTKAVDDFRSGVKPIMIATDVCARGLDIPNVEFVINYSFPLTVEDYVHRIGRTGRAGSTGSSFTFFTVFDKSLGGQLVDVLRGANQIVPQCLEKYAGAPTKAKRHKLYGHVIDDNRPMKAPTKIIFDD